MIAPTVPALILSACSIASRTVDLSRLGPARQVQVFEGGRPVSDRSIAPGSDDDRTVASWLRSHPTGWKSTGVTYAPKRRIRGEDYELNFIKDRCVLNYRVNDRGDWVQVARAISPDDPIPDLFGPATTPR